MRKKEKEFDPGEIIIIELTTSLKGSFGKPINFRESYYSYPKTDENLCQFSSDRQEYGDKEELKFVGSSVSGNVSSNLMVDGRLPDNVSTIRSVSSFHPATNQQDLATATAIDGLEGFLRQPPVASTPAGGRFSDSMISRTPDNASVIRSKPTLYSGIAKEADVLRFGGRPGGCSREIFATVREASRVSRVVIALALPTEHTQEHAKTDTTFGIPITVGGKGLVAETELTTEADAAKASATSGVDSAAGNADVAATTIAAEAAGDEPTASAKVKLKAAADAIKAIEANSVADKAIAAENTNAALKAMAVTVDAPKATATTLSVKVDTTPAEAKSLLLSEATATKVAGAKVTATDATEAAAAETKCKGMQPADDMNIDEVSPTALQLASESVMNSADADAKFKAEAIAGDNNTHSTRITTASRLSESLTGCPTTQANRAGCVFNMVTVANTVATAAEEGTSADPEAKFVGALSVNAGTVKDNPFACACLAILAFGRC